METFAERLAIVRARIAAAATRSGRDPGSVRVVAISKTQPAEAVATAIAAGVDAIGENRVQEAAGKRATLGPGGPPWHLVGPLQRNKARRAVELFDVVESLERVELADALERLAAEAGRRLPVLVEVNVGGEASKTGVAPASAAPLVAHVATRCPHLRVDGLMTVPPYDPDPEHSRPHFVALRALRDRLAGELGRPLALSMGMSEDFEVAVEEGADLVRLGRILFGARHRPA